MPQKYESKKQRAKRAKLPGQEGRILAGLSRTAKRVALNLGIVPGYSSSSVKVKKVRDQRLDDLDAYYEGRAYDHLTPWDECNADPDDRNYVPIRQRKPRVQVNLAKVFAERVAGRLVGADTFPKFEIEDDPDTTELLRLVIKQTNLRARLLEPMRRLGVAGSVFVRFSVMVNDQDDAVLNVEHYPSKHCYPETDEIGDLTAMRIQYVYTDHEQLDEKGSPKQFWFRLDLGRMADTLYDNPEYKDNEEPKFEVVDFVEHGLGYVQGEWFKTGENQHSPDGPSLIEDNIPLIDEINYSLSQSSQAVSYNQEPLLTIKGMQSEELEGIFKSSTKALALGKDGEANYVESPLEAVNVAGELRDKCRLAFQDVARISLHDPEKLDGNALSGKAMEILHGPFVELINDLRALIDEPMRELVLKILLTFMKSMGEGADFGIIVPKGYEPKGTSITIKWPPVFAQTMTDKNERADYALKLANANIFSREWAARFLAADAGIEDIEEELAKVAAQPVINPYGAF